MLSFLDGWVIGENADTQIKTIVNEYHYPPKVIDDMYLDDFDYHGVSYWYEVVNEMHEKIKSEK